RTCSITKALNAAWEHLRPASRLRSLKRVVDARPKIIAVFNTNPEVLDLVRESLQSAGYATVVAQIDDLKRGRVDMIQFIDEHEPDVIVYDIGPPYDTNWTFLRLMRNSKVMQGRAFVVTTTNQRALEELIGPTDVV